MKKSLLHIALITVLALVITGMSVSDTKASDIDKIEKGVFVEGVDISGMTSLEAQAAVNSYVSQLSDTLITLGCMNGNDVVVSAKELGLRWSNHEIVEEALLLGKAGNIVQRYKALKDLEHQNMIYPLEVTYDDAAIKKTIEEKCLEFNTPAVDGTLKRENGQFIYTPGQTGVEIDVEASVDTVKNTLALEGTGKPVKVDLVAKVAEPRGSEEQLTAVKDVLGLYNKLFFIRCQQKRQC